MAKVISVIVVLLLVFSVSHAQSSDCEIAESMWKEINEEFAQVVNIFTEAKLAVALIFHGELDHIGKIAQILVFYSESQQNYQEIQIDLQVASRTYSECQS